MDDVCRAGGRLRLYRRSPRAGRAAGERADPRSRRDDAAEVERIRGRHKLRRADVLVASNLAKQLHRFGPSKLFADEARHESTAANFSLRFHAPERHEQIAPWRRDGFAREEIAEHDSPSEQELAGNRFAAFQVTARPVSVRSGSSSSPCFGANADSSAHRPGTYRARRPWCLAVASRRFGSISARRFSKPSAVTSPAAASSHSPSSTALVNCLVSFTTSDRKDAPRRVSDSRTCRAASERPCSRSGRLPCGRHAGRSKRGRVQQPGRIVAQKQRDRRRACRPHPTSGAALAAFVIVECRMRRQPSPHDFTRDAQLIEQIGRVLPDSLPQDVDFPRSRRNFVTLQLLDDVKRTVEPVELRPLLQVLPLIQEPHEIARVDRLNLPAKPAEREAMDPREHPAVAPFDVGSMAQTRSS